MRNLNGSKGTHKNADVCADRRHLRGAQKARPIAAPATSRDEIPPHDEKAHGMDVLHQKSYWLFQAVAVTTAVNNAAKMLNANSEPTELYKQAITQFSTNPHGWTELCIVRSILLGALG